MIQVQPETLLIAENFIGPITSNEGWVIYYCYSSYLNRCGSCFGGYGSFYIYTQILKTFELPPHYQIIISFTFLRIDYWNNICNFIVYVDNVQVSNKQYSNADSSTNICGSSSWSDSENQIEIQADHYSSTSTILMAVGEIYNCDYWAISNFKLFIKKCPNGCISCNAFECFNQVLVIELFSKRWFDIINNWEGWYSDGDVLVKSVFQCGDFNGLISQSFQNRLKKSFNLIGHKAISLNLKVVILNSVSPKVQISIDQRLVSSFQLSRQVFTYWEFCNFIIVNQINIAHFYHNNEIITIQITVDFSNRYSASYSQQFGIRDFQLYIIPYLITCQDQNIQPFDGCFALQYDCVEGCSNCINGICVECSNGWVYVQEMEHCEPICGDSKIIYLEECDDGNTIPFDGCHLCKFSCPQNCLFCQFGRCLEYYQTETLIEINNIFDFYGLNQYKNAFQEINFKNYFINFLDFGYQRFFLLIIIQLNPINYDNLLNSLNYSKLTIFYKKYDQNEYDVLEQKQFHKHLRIQNCQEQLLNKCKNCELFFKLSFNEQKCIPLCGDGITILNEICDDKNNIQFDGCYKCEKSCQLECLSCIESKCYTCQNGWALLDDRCYQKCGDGQLAITSSEQCDDGNFEPNDGCYNCQFECDQFCFSCASNDICFRCLDYFEVLNGKCKPICGDLYVVPGLEECEDDNQKPYDGCYNCQFSCDENCEKDKCQERGRCIQCQSGFYIINEGLNCEVFKNQQNGNYEEEDQQNIIITKCGDQIRQSEEQCDDGNLNNFDGCSEKCLIEDGWKCDEKISNICYQYPVIQLSYLNVTQDKQYVQLSFSQQVRWNGTKNNFSDAFNLTIQGLQDNEFNVIINTVVAIEKDHPNYPIYEFEIKLLHSVDIQPLLEIFINDLIVDDYDYPLNNFKQQVQLKILNTLSDSLLSVANSFQAMGNYIMIGLGCSSGLMFLMGDLSSSFEIFDALQFQSYLRFLNVEFPENLQMYFQSSDVITIQPVLMNFKIIDVFENLIGQNYLASVGKLSLYQLNADLLSNIYGQITQFAFFIFLYFVILFYQKFFYSKCFKSKYIYYTRLSNSKIILYLVIKFYYLNKKFLKLSALYTLNGFKQLFYANSWDLIFKVIMYLVSNNQIGLRYQVSNCVSIGYLILLFYIFCSHFKRQNQKIVLLNLRMEQHEGVILMKKFTFLIVLIGMQQEQIYQCTALTFILFSYIFFIIIVKFTSSNLDLFVVIWMEAPVMLFTLISLIYCTEFKQLLNQNQKILVAFIQIGLLVLALFGPIIKAGVLFYEKIKNYIKEKQKLKPPIVLNVNNIFTIVQK
ncbi:unnamed protein product [Paramecium sonneborni]|uniref:Uncharacterized protein n=1 Tax=Paramecium sonneborni TaxID=65129 RepID=A0A8S1RR45_9CILI|nr:unnamed protein product [Paramecium sonneborni]